MDVDSMNEKLKHRGTLRLRHALKPDEGAHCSPSLCPPPENQRVQFSDVAYLVKHTTCMHNTRHHAAFGMIFNFDGVVVDTRTLLAHAWQSLAAARELPLPSSPGALRQLVLLSSQPNVNCPERMVMDVLGWTRDVRAARELTWQLAEHYQQALAQAPGPSAGLIQWLNALTNFNVPCALVSRLDKATVRRALERCHLHDHFSVMITGEDEAETLSQRLLSASLQLHRPPNHCVVFEDSPEGITAAHNCTMRVVGVASQWHPAYALRSADLTVANLSGLTVYNMRRLFANVGNEFMDLKQQAVARRDGGQGGGGGHNPNARGRRVRNAMLDP